jgi:O-acetyl-ADP-ribose deacetylase
MIKITAKQGNITYEKVDAIVNPANSYGLMIGGVAKAIISVGGAIIEAEAVQKSPGKIGEAFLTGAGMLSCRYVIHSPTMEKPGMAAREEDIKKAVFASLKTADDNNLLRIAMPGMGTGIGGFEPIDGAYLIVDEIKKFKAKTLKEVILVDISEMMVKAFKDALKEKK